MNENVVDILIYLYENYMDGSQDAPDDQNQIQDELLQAGFQEHEIDRAFQWMDELVVQQSSGRPPLSHGVQSFRVFTEEEQYRLDADCRGFLMFLEQSGILDHEGRELVIDRAIALEQTRVSVEELKWVALLVLINQPGKEGAFAQMEELVYEDMPSYLH